MVRNPVLLFVFAALSCAPAHAVTFEWATIGSPGNADDIHGEGYGGVDDTYRIGKHEVTAGQYTEFLNAVAAMDPHGLYSPAMWSNPQGCKIERLEGERLHDGEIITYTYRVAPDRANRPVNYVSYVDAMRFVNWLHNGQGSGDTESGVYNLSDGLSETRLADAKYWIPSEDEWYKAAYYDASAGVYYDYATGTDSIPSNALIEPDPGNNGNFAQPGSTADSRVTIGPPYYLTEVGEFENSASPYGTFDQTGNVYEWNEAVFSSTSRGLRGGSFNYGLIFGNSLHADVRTGGSPAVGYYYVGFRVASAIPEPTTLALALTAALLTAATRRSVR